MEKLKACGTRDHWIRGKELEFGRVEHADHAIKEYKRESLRGNRIATIRVAKLYLRRHHKGMLKMRNMTIVALEQAARTGDPKSIRRNLLYQKYFSGKDIESNEFVQALEYAFSQGDAISAHVLAIFWWGEWERHPKDLTLLSRSFDFRIEAASMGCLWAACGLGFSLWHLGEKRPGADVLLAAANRGSGGAMWMLRDFGFEVSGEVEEFRRFRRHCERAVFRGGDWGTVQYVYDSLARGLDGERDVIAAITFFRIFLAQSHEAGDPHFPVLFGELPWRETRKWHPAVSCFLGNGVTLDCGAFRFAFGRFPSESAGAAESS